MQWTCLITQIPTVVQYLQGKKFLFNLFKKCKTLNTFVTTTLNCTLCQSQN